MRIAVAVVLVAVEMGWTAFPTAQSRPAPPAAATAASAASELQVEVRSRAVRPGEVLAIDVQSPETVTAVSAALGDRGIPMWRVSPRTWRGVAGLDVEQPPGPLALAVTATQRRGHHWPAR